MPAPHELPDEELSRLWLDGAADAADGSIFIAVYGRYRDLVRDEMVAVGLDFTEAEALVGSVFVRAREAARSPAPEVPATRAPYRPRARHGRLQTEIRSP